jgi:acyl-CoA reductase-like NAD-dependent aldehyde dehydrogenase
LLPVEGGFVQFDPLGVVTTIPPCHGPFIVPVLVIAPKLLAGNFAVLKPSVYSLRTGQIVGDLYYQSFLLKPGKKLSGRQTIPAMA